jgi:hypothetical protein
MKRAVIAGLCVAGLEVAFACNASAAVWHWMFIGPVGGKQVIFNRFELAIVPQNSSPGKLAELVLREDLPKHDEDAEIFNATDANSGFQRRMEFTRSDKSGRKLVLMETSSRKIAHSARLICGRDEIKDTFRKVYRLEREGESPARAALACMEYQLSTRGGRPCINR